MIQWLDRAADEAGERASAAGPGGAVRLPHAGSADIGAAGSQAQRTSSADMTAAVTAP